MVGLVQGCFKVYWGLFRVGFRVGLTFLQGFLMVWFRVMMGFVRICFKVGLGFI